MKTLIGFGLVLALSFAAACVGSTQRTNGNGCDKVEYCAIGYHHPANNLCVCVPD